jgi:DNA end-binding protein Ku
VIHGDWLDGTTDLEGTYHVRAGECARGVVCGGTADGYHGELRDLDDYDIPGDDLQKYKVTKKEIEMAGQLIDGLTADWNPKDFHDEYHDALMKLIEKKIASGKTEVIESDEDAGEEEAPTINFMDVLKKSVEQSGKRTGQSARRKKASTTKRKGTKKATRKRKSGRKQRAG